MRRKTVAWAFCLGGILRFVVGMQGFDDYDVGYSMTFYQNIFMHSDALPFHYNFYLTGILGGLWQLAFSKFGLLGFRFLDLIVEGFGVLMIFKSFESWIKSDRLAFMAIVMTFLFPTVYVTFYYNTFTFFVVAASVLCLTRWMLLKKRMWLVLAGTMIGVSFFVRSVNVFLILLILIPFWSGVRRSFRCGILFLVDFVTGVFLGIILILLLMLSLGHVELFFNSITQASDILGSENQSHAVNNLIGVYFMSALNVGLLSLAVLFLVVTYDKCCKFDIKLKVVGIVLIVVIMGLLIITNRPYAVALALSTVLLLGLTSRFLSKRFYSPEPSESFRMIALFILLAVWLLPLGSDTGVESNFNRCGGMLCIIPATSCFQWMKNKSYQTAYVLWGLVVSLGMFVKMVKPTFDERQSRLYTTTVAVPHSLNVMVGHERAARYQNIVHRIREYGERDSLLLVCNQMAELYYATEKIPFTGNTNLDAYLGVELIEQLDKQRLHYSQLPMIVYTWQRDDTQKVKTFRKDIAPWMRKHLYELIYKDNDIQIYLPKK